MPDPDGFAVCRRLKIHPETRNIPIIFLSGETNIDEQVEGLRLGAVDFIRKPVRPDELVARVKNHIELGRLHASLEETLQVQDIQFRTAWESMEAPIVAAVEAGDWALVARLFEPNAFLKLQQFAACRSLILKLPKAAILAEPSLGFWRAYTLMASGRVADARHAVGEIDGLPTTPLERSRIKSLLARITDLQGDSETAVELAREGLALADGAPAARAALAHHWLGTSLYGAGKPVEASEHFLSGITYQEEEQGVRRWLIPLVMCWYARCLFMQGRYNDAMTVCRNAFASEREYGGPSVSLNYAIEADLLIARNLLDMAQQSMEKANDPSATASRWLSMPASGLTTAALKYAQDDQAGGDTIVADLVKWAKQNDAGHSRDKAESMRTLAWLRSGNLEKAQAWVSERELTDNVEITFAGEPILLALARVYLHTAIETGDIALAERSVNLARRLQEAAKKDARNRDCLPAMLVEALATLELGDVDRALAGLERAMAIAIPESAFRVFIDEGGPMLNLLLIALQRGKLPETTAGLIAMFQPEATPSDASGDRNTVNPLTDREFELLNLLAEGRSNAELAETLYISNNTVKTHIKHLYQKLNAGSRSQALDQARTLGLIG
jgi:ATP/maltotriose-dependent transcriptional regulator MalT